MTRCTHAWFPSTRVFMGVLPHTRSLCSPVQDFHIRSRAHFIQPQVLAQLAEVLPEKWTWCPDASRGGCVPRGQAHGTAPSRRGHRAAASAPEESTWSRDAAREARAELPLRAAASWGRRRSSGQRAPSKQRSPRTAPLGEGVGGARGQRLKAFWGGTCSIFTQRQIPLASRGSHEPAPRAPVPIITGPQRRRLPRA